jgi:predicted flavoprotein YhiN
VPVLQAAGIAVNPFKPTSSRFLVKWSKVFRERFAGTPLKNVALTYAGHRVRGEAMISSEGIEGGAIYALSKGMREMPGHPLHIDLRPDLTLEALAARLARPRGKDTQSNYLRKVAGLTPVAISLLRETGTAMDAVGIKAVAVQILRPAGIGRAISSAGGIAQDEVDAFPVAQTPGVCAVGGCSLGSATSDYLLQACFSTAVGGQGPGGR